MAAFSASMREDGYAEVFGHNVRGQSISLGITTKKDDLIKTENKLKKYFKKEEWNRVNSQLVLFGRYVCTSIKPKCENCNLKSICKKTSK